MLQTIIGQKKEQSQTYTPEGVRIPVTKIIAGPCTIVQKKNVITDGYNAVQLGFGERRVKTISKAQIGHMKKAGLQDNPPRFLREVEVEERENLDVLKEGTVISVNDVLKEGDMVNVIGCSKGKGFQGVVKRHHFKGGPRTHGQSDRERAPGAIGQTTTPGRVYKGKRMAGRMGNDQVTIKNLKVIKIDIERNTLTVKGLIPGARNGFLLIRKII